MPLPRVGLWLLIWSIHAFVLNALPSKTDNSAYTRGSKSYPSSSGSFRKYPKVFVGINLHQANQTQWHTSDNINKINDNPFSPCTAYPLKPSLWQKLNMNSYLDSYPNGTLLNLEQYASQVGALDFQCGIGKICNPGQLCQTVKGQDWYALVVAQNWNNFVNMLYQASGDAFDVIADILPEMTAWVGLVGTWVSSFPASLFKSFGVIPGTIWSWGTISWLSIVMVLYNITAFGWVNTLIIRGNGEDRFKRSSSISWMLGEAQQVVQRIIANITQVILQSGISTEQGLASVNRDGLFLSGTPVTDRASIQKEYEEVLKLRTLVKLWRCQNVFIVRGAEPCTQEGENGAFGDPGRLSYCGDDAIMMSIVRVNSESDEVDPFIFGAPLVAKKYGFTTEYLTTTSWQCQHKYGVFEFDPHFFRNMTNAHNLNIQKDCTVNLPVCDFTRTDMHEALENGQSIVEACRLIAGLPI